VIGGATMCGCLAVQAKMLGAVVFGSAAEVGCS
jgi:hypothetical protein